MEAVYAVPVYDVGFTMNIWRSAVLLKDYKNAVTDLEMLLLEECLCKSGNLPRYLQNLISDSCPAPAFVRQPSVTFDHR